MALKAEEVSSIIKNQIRDYEKKLEVSETGYVLSVGDGIARVKGFVLFVANTKAGDYVRIKVTKVLKNVGFAEVLKKIEKSAQKEAPAIKPVKKEPEVKNKELDIEIDPKAEESEDFGGDIDDFEP